LALARPILNPRPVKTKRQENEHEASLAYKEDTGGDSFQTNVIVASGAVDSSVQVCVILHESF